jgi:hypothetical protein
MNNNQPGKKRVRKSLLVGFGAVAVLLLAVVIALGVSLFSEQEGKEMPSYHPFRSAEAKEQYLKLYDLRAKKWPVACETRMVDTSYGSTFVRISGPRLRQARDCSSDTKNLQSVRRTRPCFMV